MHLYSRNHCLYVERDFDSNEHGKVLQCEGGLWSKLAPQYFDILAYLMFHEGKWRTSDQICMGAFREVSQKNAWIVQKGIGVIRSAIGDELQNPRKLIRKHRFGYMFDPLHVPVGLSERPGVLSAAGVTVWLDARRVFVGEEYRELSLFNNSYLLLEHLVRNAGNVLPIERLASVVWPGDKLGKSYLLLEVRHIREALGEHYNPRILTSAYAESGPKKILGYKFALA